MFKKPVFGCDVDEVQQNPFFSYDNCCNRPVLHALGGEDTHRHTDKHTDKHAVRKRGIMHLHLYWSTFYKRIRGGGNEDLQVPRTAGGGCLDQNPSGGRKCGSKQRGTETVGNCLDDK